MKTTFKEVYTDEWRLQTVGDFIDFLNEHDIPNEALLKFIIDDPKDICSAEEGNIRIMLQFKWFTSDE